VADATVSDFEDQGDSVVVTTAGGQTFSGAVLVAAGRVSLAADVGYWHKDGVIGRWLVDS
jgi:hypothetical protein